MSGIGLLGDLQKLEGLEVAERGFPLLFENFTDLFANRFLDEVVHVCKGITQPLVELAPHG